MASASAMLDGSGVRFVSGSKKLAVPTIMLKIANMMYGRAGLILLP